MASLDLILGIIGGISGGSAIVATAAGAVRSRRHRRVRHHLELQLTRLRRLNRRITAITVVINRKLAANLEDRGAMERSTAVKGDLTYLDNIVLECEETVAYLRSLDADGGLERLRADVETLANRMGQAAALYLESAFLVLENRARTPNAIYFLSPAVIDELEELKRETLFLFRTCAHRYGLEHRAADPVPVLWPIREAHLQSLPPEQNLWGSEPQPMS